MVPRVLTIAGSDSGGGAGIQADLKTFAAHGVFGMSAVTSVTAQNTTEVASIHPVPAAIVADQIDAVFGDLGADTVKIGMLGGVEVVEVVADRLDNWSGPPVILDPVMVAKSGDALLADDAVDALRGSLLHQATLVTPNLPEAERLVGSSLSTPELVEEAAWVLAGLGPAVLIKGGHAGGETVVDLLLAEGEFTRFEHPRIQTRATHGTGCTLSSAIAARMARGERLVAAVRGAITYLQEALGRAPGLGRGHGPLQHFPRGVIDV